MLIAFAKDIRGEVVALNEINKNNGKNRKLHEKLHDFIQFHTDTNQLSYRTLCTLENNFSKLIQNYSF